MTGEFRPETYGDHVADVYDEMYRALDPASEVSLLAELAGDGPVLELGIGTGRVALPLAERGLEVRGIDASKKMVEELKAKEGGREIDVTIGDFAEFDLPGPFSLVFVVFNTFYGLDSQDAQVRCFQTVARHLQPGGRFLLAGFVPDPRRMVGGQHVSVPEIHPDGVKLDVAKVDPVEQTITFQHLLISDGGVRLYPGRLRWCWPSELDLMARIAGLRLEHRWADFDKAPLTPKSQNHISVYVKG